MIAFDILQSSFLAKQFSAFGLSGQNAEILQPPAVLPADNDQALWAYFNTIPEAGAIHAPSGSDFFSAYSAVIGALISSGNPLDPIAAAKRQLAAWGSAPPRWSIDYAGMSRALANAASLAFDFAAVPTHYPDFWGLVGGAPPPAVLDPSATFASGEVGVTVAVSHLLAFAPQPGDWYVSSALSLAYRSPGAPPWDPASPVTWDTAFGPNGTLRRMASALIVVSGLDAAAISTATFNAAARKAIKSGAAVAGAWPYYLTPPAAATGVTFDADGRLALTIKSKGKTAIALAAIVQSAASYLGASG